MFRKKRVFKKGFTLIGLLMATIIIIILGVIIFTLGGSSQAKARDAKRVSDLNILKSTLQLHYMEMGHYPEEVVECSIEQLTPPEGPDDPIPCPSFRAGIGPFMKENEIPGDPLFPEKEGEKFYSYQYRTMLRGEEYIIHADLETKEPYEVYSAKGNLMSPGGSGAPIVYTYPADFLVVPGFPGTKLFRGEIISHGASGITEWRGFQWKQGEGGEMNQAGMENCIPCPLGDYEHPQGGFPPVCQQYFYQAMAKDFGGSWGFGEEVEFWPCY